MAAPAKLKVSEEVADGVLLWNASLVLKNYLENKCRDEFDGASVLELGSSFDETCAVLMSSASKLGLYNGQVPGYRTM